ncbi:hypothetical protein AltI4_44660 (plasmid) [Alteromonas sp. I4]|nr:hypothetical protein AltI4_44660 [Alteromonas sp. I4]
MLANSPQLFVSPNIRNSAGVCTLNAQEMNALRHITKRSAGTKTPKVLKRNSIQSSLQAPAIKTTIGITAA